MKKVLVTPLSFGKVTGEAFDILKNAGFDVFINPYGRIITEPEMIEHIADMDALIVDVDPVTRAVIDAVPKLKVISKYGVGLDNIDVDYAKHKGIKVTITAGANTDAVADYAFTLMLAAARNVVPIDRGCRNLDWSKVTTLGIYVKRSVSWGPAPSARQLQSGRKGLLYAYWHTICIPMQNLSRIII